MSKSICHVISGYFRDNPRIFERQCLSLHDIGYEVTILTNDGGSKEIVSGINIIPTQVYFESRLKVIIFATFQFIREAKKINADYYQLHSPELLPLGLILKLFRKKVLYDAHEDIQNHILDKERIPKYFRKFLSKIVTALMDFSLRIFDGLLTPHNHVYDKLIRLNKNTKLITNFPKTLSKAELKSEEYMQRDNILCYSGTVYPHSSQPEIITAIKDLHNISYHIAGVISDDMKPMFTELESNKRFRFLGYLPANKLSDFYTKSTIGICVINYMGNLGFRKGTFAVNKIFEYMASGLPIICSDYDLWKEFVERYNCGICVEPMNAEQIKGAIEFLSLNKNIAYKMGQNGKNAILKEFNWAKEEKKYLSLFE